MPKSKEGIVVFFIRTFIHLIHKRLSLRCHSLREFYPLTTTLETPLLTTFPNTFVKTIITNIFRDDKRTFELWEFHHSPWNFSLWILEQVVKLLDVVITWLTISGILITPSNTLNWTKQMPFSHLHCIIMWIICSNPWLKRIHANRGIVVKHLISIILCMIYHH